MGTIYTRESAEEQCREFIDYFDLQIWPRPIHVRERLPDHLERVLVYAGDDWYCDRRGWKDEGVTRPWMYCDNAITHWLPMLPKPTSASAATQQ